MNDVEKRTETIDFMEFPGEGSRKVEAKAVHVHFQNPVAQTIHDQLQHTRMPHVQRVSGSRIVLVIARIARYQAVIRAVVDPFQRKRRAQMIALCGVVVDDVKNYFQSCGVQNLDHGFEFVD
jgi:hypothetical protein